MVEIKTLDGKINKDDSMYRLPKGDYVDSLNITHDAIEGSQDTIISNIVANREVINSFLPSGQNVTIGAYANVLRNTIIFFNWNENGYSGVYEFNADTRAVVKILLNLTDTDDVDILGFTQTGKISSINVFNRDEGDLLFFIDSIDRPTFIPIERMKADEYNPVTRQMIDAAKDVPLVPPATVYGNDTTRRVNYLRNRFFRFSYRYVYDDFFKSTYSPISEVLVPVGILDINTSDNPTQNNIITLSLFSGSKNVSAIEVAMSYVNRTNTWSDFQTVTTLNKSDLSISDDTFFSYIFNNDSTYPNTDPRESSLLYDWLPRKAKCQELINGNILGYGAITEGYNKDTEFNVVVNIDTYTSDNVPTGSLSAVVQVQTPPQTISVSFITFSGVPATGTQIKIKLKSFPSNAIVEIGSYTTIAGDTIGNGTTGIIGGLITDILANGLVINAGFGSLFFVTYNGENGSNPRYYSDYTEVEIIPPTSAGSSNSLASWKWSTERNIGIAYFDKKGRTNGILYNTNMTFPAYAEDISGGVILPYPAVYIYNRPPIWAHSYQFLFTKENTYSLFWVTNDVNTSETNYIYFEVTGFITNAAKFPTTDSVLSYTFQEGDRIRLIKPVSDNSYFADTLDTQILGYLDSPTINGVAQTDKRFLKINKTTVFNITYSQDNYVIEIYRPLQQNASEANETYYEAGLQYAILNPETADRVHAGQLTDQSTDLVTPASFNFKNGDWYFRIRNIALSETGSATFNVMDRNIVDTFTSAVNSIEGRPNVIDLNAREAYYGATIRNGQAYQPNTNINGFNRFFEDDLIDLDFSYGSVRAMVTRDRLVRVFQESKIGMLPVFSQINKTNDGTAINVVTDKLLNPVQYYVGDWGIGTAPESLASFNFADYFCDNMRGAVCRVSNDGVKPISILFKMNSWATYELPLRKNTYKIYGAFEQRQNNYVIALEATNVSAAQTLTFDEERNGFDSFVSYHPEMMVNLGVLFVTFKNGALWTHDNEPFYNNFYGVQYDSTITPVFNQNEITKKTFIAITELSTQAWDCPEIETSSNVSGNTKQISNLAVSDFEEKEGDYHASFLRASNSDGGIIEGQTLKGNLIKIKFRAINEQPPNNRIVTLNLLSVSSIVSELNNK